MPPALLPMLLCCRAQLPGSTFLDTHHRTNPPRHTPAPRRLPRSLQVEFRLLGFIPGSVGLRGRFVSIPEREGGEDRKDTVKVRGGLLWLCGAGTCGLLPRSCCPGLWLQACC